MRLLLLLLFLSSSLLVINNIWSLRRRQRQRQRRLRLVVPVTFVFATAAVVFLDWWVTFLTVKMNMITSKSLVVGRRRFPFFLHVEAWSPSHTAAVTSVSASRRSIAISTNSNSLLPIACHPPPSSLLKRRSTPFCLKYMSSVVEHVEDSSNDNNDTEDDIYSSSSSSYHADTTTTTKNNKMMFELTTPYEPTGDQPQAIDTLVNQIERGDKYSVLRGITGSGKSFVMANTIARVRTLNMIAVERRIFAAMAFHADCSSYANNSIVVLLSVQ